MNLDPRNGVPQILQNKRIHFHIRDVYVPEPAQLLAELHGGDLLHGRIVDLSDRGLERGAFAVVEVDGLGHPVVVPVTKIVSIEDGPGPGHNALGEHQPS